MKNFVFLALVSCLHLGCSDPVSIEEYGANRERDNGTHDVCAVEQIPNNHCNGLCQFVDPDCESPIAVDEPGGGNGNAGNGNAGNGNAGNGNAGNGNGGNGNAGNGNGNGNAGNGNGNGNQPADLCQEEDRYGDGACDQCPRPDPDCEEDPGNGNNGNGNQPVDHCQEEGRYGDGACDRCPRPDPDCEEGPGNQPVDHCQEEGRYGDGVCDRCPRPDPDCEEGPGNGNNGNGNNGNGNNGNGNNGNGDPDLCDQTGRYGDGICDEYCPRPDPDCEAGNNGGGNNGGENNGGGNNGGGNDAEGNDLCEALGWYGDGECDEVCLMPDPDCEPDANNGGGNNAGGNNVNGCGALTYHGECVGHQARYCNNGEVVEVDCDDLGQTCGFVNQQVGYYCVDNQAGGGNNGGDDVCVDLGRYNNGVCNPTCPNEDPDCTRDGDDVCDWMGWNNDGECDRGCPADPDC